MRKFIFFALLGLCVSCDTATVLEGIGHIPKDYIEGLKLDSSKIKLVEVFVIKAGRPVVQLSYDDEYQMVFFSCTDSVAGRLQDFLSFRSNSNIETSPNISHAGILNLMEVRFPIKYSNVVKEPFELVTLPNSERTILALNDSTSFILLKDSRGFTWRSLHEDYAGIVVNVRENQITGFDGKVDLGIFIYQRQKKDYLMVVSPSREGGLMRVNDLFETLNLPQSDRLGN